MLQYSTFQPQKKQIVSDGSDGFKLVLFPMMSSKKHSNFFFLFGCTSGSGSSGDLGISSEANCFSSMKVVSSLMTSNLITTFSLVSTKGKVLNRGSKKVAIHKMCYTSSV